MYLENRCFIMTTRPDSRSKGLQASTAQKSALDTLRTLRVNDIEYDYHSISALDQLGLTGSERLPVTLRILLENLLRRLGSSSVTVDDVKAMLAWADTQSSTH